MMERLLYVSVLTIGLAAPALIPPSSRVDGFPRPVPAVGAAGGTIDVNCDGIDDILLQNAAGWIGTFIMDGSGRPAEFRFIYPGPTSVRVVGTGDLNSDGVSDMLALDHQGRIGGIHM